MVDASRIEKYVSGGKMMDSAADCDILLGYLIALKKYLLLKMFYPQVLAPQSRAQIFHEASQNEGLVEIEANSNSPRVYLFWHSESLPVLLLALQVNRKELVKKQQTELDPSCPSNP